MERDQGRARGAARRSLSRTGGRATLRNPADAPRGATSRCAARQPVTHVVMEGVVTGALPAHQWPDSSMQRQLAQQFSHVAPTACRHHPVAHSSATHYETRCARTCRADRAAKNSTAHRASSRCLCCTPREPPNDERRHATRGTERRQVRTLCAGRVPTTHAARRSAPAPPPFRRCQNLRGARDITGIRK